ncbi:MAG TPA: immunoglobulin domain-containing protein [Candidatus Acidoferrum sp.]|nr:immunoglobulin domain-containing protein [Candidatus Acidoferrum sp.]
MKTTQSKSLMKPLLAFAVVLGLAVLGAAVAQANDLTNPDLDQIGNNGQINQSPDSWQIKSYRTISNPTGDFLDGADSEGWCNVQQANGYGLFFKPFQGSTNANPVLDDYLTVYFYQDNPCSAGTSNRLSGFAAGEANFCALDPAPSGLKAYALFVVEYLDNGGNILASNAYDLVVNGMPTAGPGSMAQLTTPWYKAPDGTVTVRSGSYLLNAWSTSGAQSFFVDAFDLETVPAPGSPVITGQPSPVTASLGGNASFTVTTSPVATTNAWLFNGAPVSDVAGHISGSSTATLTITGVTTSDVGHYQALVSNSSGLNRSKIAPLAITTQYIFPTVSINGKVGDTYQVYSSLSVGGPYTNLVSTVKLTTSPQYVVDYTLPVSTSKFYKAVYVP